MKRMMICSCLAILLFSCNSSKEKPVAVDTKDTTSKTMIDLPYKASFSSEWSDDVSDADLKTVIVSYKDWADGNMSKVAEAYGDTLAWDRSTGEHLRLPKADIMKMWSIFHDSLSSVTIDMQAWHKMHSTDLKESFIVTWYKEIDTYKNGKADSGYYHDINRVENGKITWVEQYKRPAK